MSHIHSYANDDNFKAYLDDLLSGKFKGDRNKQEEEYHDFALKVVTKLQKFIRSQLWINRIRTLAREYKTNDLSKPQRTRQAALKELIVSERKYSEDILKEFVEKFAIPCKKLIEANANSIVQIRTPAINKAEYEALFCNVETIYEFHKMLCPLLDQQYGNWPAAPVRIGRVLKTYAKFFRLYSDYTNNIPFASKVFDHLKQRRNFRDFIESIGVTVEQISRDWLMAPVQRLMRYKLPLIEIVKNTPKDHVDYSDLVEAKDMIEEMTLLINELKRDYESAIKLKELMKTISGISINLIHQKRSFIHEGELGVNSEMIKKDRVHFYLFNDLLMATTNKGKTYNSYITLRDATVDGEAPPDSTEFSVSFSHPRATVKFKAETCDSKQIWVDSFNAALDNLNSIPKEKAPDLGIPSFHLEQMPLKNGFVNVSITTTTAAKTNSQRFWFVQTCSNLDYYKKEDLKDFEGCLQLEICNIRLVTESSFELYCPEIFSYEFEFETINEMLGWQNSFVPYLPLEPLKPITKLCVINLKSDTVPRGYTCLKSTIYCRPATCNIYRGRGNSDDIRICFERGGTEESTDEPLEPITEIGVATRCSKLIGSWALENLRGWTVILNTFSGKSANLNINGSTEVYLAFRRDKGKLPVTSISLFSKERGEKPLPDYHVADRSISKKYSGSLSFDEGTKKQTFIQYKRTCTCDISRDEKPLLLDNDIGWDPEYGFFAEKLPPIWKDFLLYSTATPDELEDPELSCQILEAVNKSYSDIKDCDTRQISCSFCGASISFYRQQGVVTVVCQCCGKVNGLPWCDGSEQFISRPMSNQFQAVPPTYSDPTYYANQYSNPYGGVPSSYQLPPQPFDQLQYPPLPSSSFTTSPNRSSAYLQYPPCPSPINPPAYSQYPVSPPPFNPPTYSQPNYPYSPPPPPPLYPTPLPLAASSLAPAPSPWISPSQESIPFASTFMVPPQLCNFAPQCAPPESPFNFNAAFFYGIQAAPKHLDQKVVFLPPALFIHVKVSD